MTEQTVKRYHPHHPHIDDRAVVLAEEHDDAIRALQSRLDAAEQELRASDLRLAQADYNYDMDRNQWRQQLAERDALLREWLDGKSNVAELVAQCEALLSASAEPAEVKP